MQESKMRTLLHIPHRTLETYAHFNTLLDCLLKLQMFSLDTDLKDVVAHYIEEFADGGADGESQAIINVLECVARLQESNPKRKEDN